MAKDCPNCKIPMIAFPATARIVAVEAEAAPVPAADVYRVRLCKCPHCGGTALAPAETAADARAMVDA